MKNIVDIDLSALQVTLRGSQGALVLFDFKAAFPSIDHSYLWSTLAHIGIPAPVLRCYKLLYARNKHKFQVRGRTFDSIDVHSGVRQGCPLSPHLFVLCTEPLLRELSRLVPDGTWRAYADDVGAVIPRIGLAWGSIIDCFTTFAEASNLHIHRTKTTVIPLWPITAAEFRSLLWLSGSAWHDVTVAFKAKY